MILSIMQGEIIFFANSFHMFIIFKNKNSLKQRAISKIASHVGLIIIFGNYFLLNN